MFKKDQLQIIPFKTYGTSEHLYLRGRALEDEGIDLEKTKTLSVLVNSWKRFETDELRHTPITVSLEDGEKLNRKTDAEGYYNIDQVAKELNTNIDAEGWLSYAVSFSHDYEGRLIQGNNSFTGEMLIPPKTAKFGVISDIDDTILHTGVTSRLKWRLVVNTFFKTPYNRKALEGSSYFYQKLHEGLSKKEGNPIFYVSNSPWNLYRYLDVFLEKNNFPKGPILLRDFRTPFDRTPRTELAHKYHEIYNILNTYPDLNFILIGDCGEKDAYIYLDVVKAFPNRISAIYLRAVEHKSKMRKIANVFKEFNEIPVLLVESTDQVMEHAKQHQFIN